MLCKRIVTTSTGRIIEVQAANAVTVLEVMARFALNPKWLIHLPPTMSPCETSSREGLVEYPDEAFAYFQKEGVERVVIEEKYMGSRARAVVCRTADPANSRFWITSGETGALYTRPGQSFFSDADMTEAMLRRIRAAMDVANFWGRFETDWALLDAELMPWPAKAQALLPEQYAATGGRRQRGLAKPLSYWSKRAAPSFRQMTFLRISCSARLGRISTSRPVGVTAGRWLR